MKTRKIILFLTVVSVIALLVWGWRVVLAPLPVIKPPTNQFTARIEHEIDSLRKAHINVFCQQFYLDIQYRINEYHKQGFLGKTVKDNTQWRDILSKNLYSAYAPKFAEQALYLFNGPEWAIPDLNFIRREVTTLQNSSYLEAGSSVDKSFKNIRTILSKYDEIAGFISSCRNFAYSHYAIADHFPVDEVSNKIQRSKIYLSKKLENSYVNNCIRLKDGLHGTPQNLFDKHISYLRSKIQQHSGKYSDYEFQSEYANTISTPLRSQIEEIDRNIYGISSNIFESNYQSLETLLAADNKNAMDHFRSPKKEKEEL